MPVSRLGQIAVGVKRYISFAGKTSAEKGIITRLSQIGIGARRYGDFSGKAAGRAIANITRLGQIGIGTQRYVSFAGKTPAAPKQGQEIYFLRSVGKLMNN